MKPLNMLSKIWKSFCNRDRPFSSSTWSGRLFFAQEVFAFASAANRASWYQLASFEPDFLQIQLQNTCWASPNPDIPHKIALATRFRWYRISKFSWRKICSMKIGVDSFNIASNRNYHFRFFLGILLKYTENRKECFLKTSSWLWYAFYKPSSNLENRTTVCMRYPAMTPKWESRKTPLKGGWKSMWVERHPKSEITLIRNLSSWCDREVRIGLGNRQRRILNEQQKSTRFRWYCSCSMI